MDLDETCRELGLPSPEQLLNHSFRFASGDDMIVGIVTGISTTVDGLPCIEISNRRFAGLVISNILLKGHDEAYLMTTTPEPGYRQIEGGISFSPAPSKENA